MNSKIKKIDFLEIKNLKDYIIIDVRTKEEYDISHIKDSINIDYNIIEFEIEKFVKDKSSKIILYCRSWTRSLIASMKLLSLWYTDIFDLWAFDSRKWEIE